MNLKTILLLVAACAYVGAGVVAYEILVAITGDTGFTNGIVAALALPLAVPLVYALGRIEALGGR